MADENGKDGSGAQEALQLAQQAAQAARQATQQAEQAVQAAQQAARGVGAETSGATVETVISPQATDAAWRANLKGQFDRFQSLDLEAFGSRRSSDGHLRRLEVLAEKSLEQCISGSEMERGDRARQEDLLTAAQLRALGRLLAGEPEDVVDAD